MSVNKEETLRQFCDVTGTDEARSRFFLESSNWQLEVALSSFYEHGGNADDVVTGGMVSAPIPTLSDSDAESTSTSPPKQQPQKTEKKKTVIATKFATLESLHQESSSDDEEVSKCGQIKDRVIAYFQEFFWNNPSTSKKFTTTSQQSGDALSKDAPSQELISVGDQTVDIRGLMEEIERLKSEVERLSCENNELKEEIARLRESDQGQAFYAGGSERSGQQILGPGKSRKDIVTEMFKSVRERGAVVFDEEQSSSSRGRSGVFSGVGYRLGQTSDDHEQVTPAGGQPQAQSRLVRLCLYREGFTVDAGALRHYSDPDNAEFLSCVRRGEIPPELAGRGGEVRVSLQDRRLEECPKNVSKTQAFTGKGHLLGSPTPPTVGATAAVASDASDRAANQRAAQQAVALDEQQPTTTIQFRLADGSRITGRFNHTHTVGDLHQYVSRAEPLYQLQPFVLLTTFPSAELTDSTTTLAAANLLNSTVMQRLK